MIQQAQLFVAWMQTKFGVDFSLDRTEEGQGLVEYALIIVLVSVVSVATLTILGTTVSGVFTTITGSL
jgi:pilus assembly protein Flp/PilA